MEQLVVERKVISHKTLRFNPLAKAFMSTLLNTSRSHFNVVNLMWGSKNTIYVVVVAFFVLFFQSVYAAESNGQVVCPMDAKLCPGGSSVGRVGPNCEFAPCPNLRECSEDAKVCPDGTVVFRKGPHCRFQACPIVACPMDAKLCPDGTSVGRVGPNCEFAPCVKLRCKATLNAKKCKVAGGKFVQKTICPPPVNCQEGRPCAQPMMPCSIKRMCVCDEKPIRPKPIVREKIVCKFSGSEETKQKCYLTSNNNKGCTGVKSCSFYVKAKENTIQFVKSSCGQRKRIVVDGRHEILSFKCGKKRICSADIKICPDGTIVRRTGKNCKFKVCPKPRPCSEDVKICPDGTAVFRKGPMCRFSACPKPAGCTMDAKICPDGTSVGRVGPNCEFAPCPKPKPCSDDVKVCADGTVVFRRGPHCRFSICPRPITPRTQSILQWFFGWRP